MKKYRLTIITENQNRPEKARKFSELINGGLNSSCEFKISKYEKLKDSYKIEFIGEIKQKSNSISESVELTDRICSPWIMWFNRTQNEIELIFNKTDKSVFRKNEFNTINWASFEIENE